MRPAPNRANEAERLAALRAFKILDTDPEESFDRLARLATRVFHVPIAHVSLIDEHREWFKAKCGITASEVDRRVAFCAHTILSDDVLIIEDVDKDERFRDNPLVTESPGIRFYAGAPLLARPGVAVGAFCIKDYTPRTLGEHQAQILEQLAAVVVQEMEHRLIEADLRRWEHVFQHSGWGVVVTDAGCRRLDMLNPTFAAMHGRTVAELRGRPVAEVVAPDCRAAFAEHVRRAHQIGHHIFESEHLRRDGSVFPVQVDVTTVNDQRGRALYRVLNVQDITERKRAEQTVRKWEHVFERAEWGIALADGENPTLDLLNRAFADMHGYAVDELLGRPIVDVFAPDCREEVARHAKIVLDRGHDVYESKHLRKDGTIFPVQIDASAVRDADGRLLYRAAHVLDITERKRVEEEIRFRNAILSTQQEAALDGILVVDHKGEIVSFNRRFVAMWGIPQEVLDTHQDEMAIEFVLDQLVDPQQFLARVKHLYAHPDETSTDEIALRDGRVFDRYSSPMIGPDREHYGRVWYFRDVTERMRADRALRESEERLGNILESAMDAIVTVDEEGVIKLFNSAAEKVFRCTAAEALGRSIDRFASPAFRELLQQSMKPTDPHDARRGFRWAPEGITALRADGEEFPLEATISRAQASGQTLYTVILRDVNERKRAEEELRKLQLENVYLREEIEPKIEFEDIVGSSPAIRKVLKNVEHVAGTDSTVLISGETGTGKELLARAIHSLSARNRKVLVTVNCAALPTGLIESELFGHEKGAFTGALARKIGRFETAHEGTIFLDEIGDLPLELQAKLLRVLQEGEFERVGGTQPLKVDVRVIAATNRDLQEEVAAQRFRADLFYRLNVFPIAIPPLRERKEDIPLLARHFAMTLGARMAKRIDSISPKTLRTLGAYHWPGNVRELHNVIERAIIIAEGPQLEVGEWPSQPIDGEGKTRTRTLEEHEREHILEVLELTGWRVSGDKGAAKILGLKPTTLEARMKKLHIKRKS